MRTQTSHFYLCLNFILPLSEYYINPSIILGSYFIILREIQKRGTVVKVTLGTIAGGVVPRLVRVLTLTLSSKPGTPLGRPTLPEHWASRSGKVAGVRIHFARC